MVNTPFGRGPRTDGSLIRAAAAQAGIPCITTLPAVLAALRGIESRARRGRRNPARCRSTTRPRRRRSPSRSGWCSGRTPPRSRRDAWRRRGPSVRRVRAEVLSTPSASARTTRSRSSRPRSPNASARDSSSRSRCPRAATFLLRRHFSIHQASRRGGWAGTLEFVFDPRGPGTSWLAEVKAHEFLDVIGPLGKAFAYPAKLSNCLLVAEGHGSAPMYFLGPGAARSRQARRHARGRRDAGARLQADRGQAPGADDRHRDGGRQPRRDAAA